MSMVVCIIVGFIALVIGFLFGKFGGDKINPHDFAEKINFTLGTENESLKKETEELRSKLLFYKDWFIRSYIEQYYRKKIAIEDCRIYTSDALNDLREYAKKALDNFEKTWNSEITNEQCAWIKEYLEELIANIDHILSDTWGNDVIDREHESALQRFFVAVEVNMMFDRNAKECGRETHQLGYWRPQREDTECC